MKIKIEVEIDTKEDINEIQDVIEIITEFKDKLIAMDEDYYDDWDHLFDNGFTHNRSRCNGVMGKLSDVIRA